jgi:hypothetical protein
LRNDSGDIWVLLETVAGGVVELLGALRLM